MLSGCARRICGAEDGATRARGGSVKPFRRARRGVDLCHFGHFGIGIGARGVGARGGRGGETSRRGGAHLSGEPLEDHGKPIGDGERLCTAERSWRSRFWTARLCVVRPRASPGLPAAGRVASVRTSLACFADASRPRMTDDRRGSREDASACLALWLASSAPPDLQFVPPVHSPLAVESRRAATHLQNRRIADG